MKKTGKKKRKKMTGKYEQKKKKKKNRSRSRSRIRDECTDVSKGQVDKYVFSCLQHLDCAGGPDQPGRGGAQWSSSD